MEKFLYKAEQMFLGRCDECEFDLQKLDHVLLLPGLGGSVMGLFPLVRFLRRNQKNYDVTVIPLGLNSAALSVVVSRALKHIKEHLIEKRMPRKIIFIGHSFGGRIACELVYEIKKRYPEIICEVITLGSPVGPLRPNHLPWYEEKLFSWFSCAYREGLPVRQPTSEIVKKYIGYYSLDDKLVIPKFAKAEHTGMLIELKGLSHNDLVCPRKIGVQILPLLN